MQVTRAWVPGTKIRLVKVPWDAQYRDVVEWGSLDDRDKWFDTLSGDEYTQPEDVYTYLRPFEPVDIGLPYNQVMKHNYIVVDNPPQEGDVKRRLYYFIVGVEYMAPQTTRVQVQLDVWTTFSPTTVWGQSFVERGHLGLANENATLEPKSLRTYQAASEDIDVGNVLASRKQWAWNLFEEKPKGEGYTQREKGTVVVVVSNADLEGDPGDIGNPNQKTGYGGYMDGIYSGQSIVCMEKDDWNKFIVAVRDYSWISRNIAMMYAFPSGFMSGTQYSWVMNDKYGGAKGFKPQYVGRGVFKNMSFLDEINKIIPDRYKIVKKLYTYPFCVIDMHNMDGSPVFLQPQLLSDEDYRVGGGNLKSDIRFVVNSIMPFARIGMYVKGYGNNGADTTLVPFDDPTTTGEGNFAMEGGDYLSTAVWFDNWPQFNLVNDSYVSYMASTAHTRAYNYQAAGWSRTKGQAQLQLQNDVTNNQLATQQANQDVSNTLQDRNRAVNVGMGALGAVGNLASGNVGGAISGALGTGVSSMQSVWNQQAQNQQFGNNQGAARYALDANQKYGQMASQGDYAMAVQSILAATQDAALTPPSTSGQMGGEGMNFALGQIDLVVQIKTMLPGMMDIVGDFFLRYGIAIRRFLPMPQKLCCMSKFAYWKLSEAYIESSEGDESSKATLRGILQKGVTVWADPSYIGRTSLYDNKPKGGYRY